MPRTERCLVREFKARMCALVPGDVLAPLSSFAPPGCRILVLDRDAEGWLTLSPPCRDLRIVGDLKGSYRWSDDAETLVDREGNPHEGIDLGTEVVKRVGTEAAVEYRELRAFAQSFSVVSEAHIQRLVNADTVLRRRIDAFLNNDWLPTVEGRFVAAFSEIFSRPLTESEQAHVIALMNFVASAIPVVDLTIHARRPVADTPPTPARH